MSPGAGAPKTLPIGLLPPSFFSRPAHVVAPELIGCLLVRRQTGGPVLWGVVVETEAYCQSEEACHGHRRRSPRNETLFGSPGRFYVYLTHGIHHCVNLVTDRADWASGVLLRAVAVPGEDERVAAGPGLLARRFAIDRRDDGRPVDPESGLWVAPRPAALDAAFTLWERQGVAAIRSAERIGISRARDMPWRWYLGPSRSVSRRRRGDRRPPLARAWFPDRELVS